MVDMKLSRIKMDRITFHSVVNSPSNKQIDSRASLTAGGGLVIDLTSTRFCFLIDETAFEYNQTKNDAKTGNGKRQQQKNKIIINNQETEKIK